MASDPLANVENRLTLLEQAIERLGSGSVVAGVGCTSQRTHAGRLIYMRGPNQYVCEVDGNVYVKDGSGGLKDG